jgi:hypothetical protein
MFGENSISATMFPWTSAKLIPRADPVAAGFSLRTLKGATTWEMKIDRVFTHPFSAPN